MALAARQRIFNSVFPSATEASVSAPVSTPVLGTEQRAGFSANPDYAAVKEDGAAEKVKWERAWHIVTAFLSLPNASITTENSFLNPASTGRKWLKACQPQTAAAIAYLVSHESVGRRLRAGRKQDDLIEWYAQEVRRHYTRFQLPILLDILTQEDPLPELLSVHWSSQALYFHILKQYVLSQSSTQSDALFDKFQNGYHAMVSVSLLESSLSDHLSSFLMRQGSTFLRLELAHNWQRGDIMEDLETSSMTGALGWTSEVMTNLNKVGLGGARAQRILAEVMTELLKIHVRSTCAGQWKSPSSLPQNLRVWVQGPFANFIVGILSCLGEESATDISAISKVTPADVSSWQQRAIDELGALRVKELFDIIVEWDNDSKGAIEDLKQYIKTTTARSHLINSYLNALSDRLLQPGASTTQILQIYVRIIRAFALLDPKGVLLDFVGRPIRHYLRGREDTVKIIVGGLLADPEEDASTTDTLSELAAELNKLTAISTEDDDGDMDWHDMNWVPDPIDAGPEYKKSKTSDVIGTLMSLFESKDIFVKEFQNILGERLLQAEFEFDKEIRVLELLKLRFGEAALQACEVMLKDVFDSRRTDTFIKKEQRLLETAPEISAKILSGLYWPALHTETFVLPHEIQVLQDRYAQGFEHHKTSRKLTWLPALGQVTVELQLKDRIVPEIVQTWQASVICAFHDAGDGTQEPVTKTVEELVNQLGMNEQFVINALTFWVGKLVLHQDESGEYRVLEDLPTTTQADSAAGENPVPAALAAEAAAASAAASATAASAVRSDEDVAEEQMEVFWQFIVGMLTNQGAMPLQRIVMMLNFAVPGGFTHGNEELRAFLGRRVAEGKLDITGGSYKIVKPMQ